MCYYVGAEVIAESKFTSTVSSNYKEVMDMNGDCHWSLDTGANGSVLSKHYFDQNKRHIVSDLFPVYHSEEELAGVRTRTCRIKNRA